MSKEFWEEKMRENALEKAALEYGGSIYTCLDQAREYANSDGVHLDPNDFVERVLAAAGLCYAPGAAPIANSPKAKAKLLQSGRDRSKDKRKEFSKPVDENKAPLAYDDVPKASAADVGDDEKTVDF